MAIYLHRYLRHAFISQCHGPKSSVIAVLFTNHDYRGCLRFSSLFFGLCSSDWGLSSGTARRHQRGKHTHILSRKQARAVVLRPVQMVASDPQQRSKSYPKVLTNIPFSLAHLHRGGPTRVNFGDGEHSCSSQHTKPIACPDSNPSFGGASDVQRVG